MDSAKALLRLERVYAGRSSLKRREFISLMRDAGVDVRSGKGGDVVFSLEGRKASMNGHTRSEVGYVYIRPVIEAIRPF